MGQYNKKHFPKKKRKSIEIGVENLSSVEHHTLLLQNNREGIMDYGDNYYIATESALSACSEFGVDTQSPKTAAFISSIVLSVLRTYPPK